MLAIAFSAGLFAWAVSRSAEASFITGATATPSSVNLTTTGATTWAIWDDQNGTSQTAPYAATNTKNINSGLISGMSALTGSPRGITGTFPSATYSYTDGVSPTSNSSVIGAVIDSNVGSVGDGVKLTITGSPGVTEMADIFVVGFDATGQLTASLSDGTTYTNSSFTYSGSRTMSEYILTFQPPATGPSTLTVSYAVSALNGASSNVGIQGVALSLVPEPSAFTLAGIGAAMAAILVWRCRRRREFAR